MLNEVRFNMIFLQMVLFFFFLIPYEGTVCSVLRDACRLRTHRQVRRWFPGMDHIQVGAYQILSYLLTSSCILPLGVGLG